MAPIGKKDLSNLRPPTSTSTPTPATTTTTTDVTRTSLSTSPIGKKDVSNLIPSTMTNPSSGQTPSKNVGVTSSTAVSASSNMTASQLTGGKFARMEAMKQQQQQQQQQQQLQQQKQQSAVPLGGSGGKFARMEAIKQKQQTTATTSTSTTTEAAKNLRGEDEEKKSSQAINSTTITRRQQQERQAQLFQDLDEAERLVFQVLDLASETAQTLASSTSFYDTDITQKLLQANGDSYLQKIKRIHSLLTPHAPLVVPYRSFRNQAGASTTATNTNNMYIERVDMKLRLEQGDIMKELLRMERQEQNDIVNNTEKNHMVTHHSQQTLFSNDATGFKRKRE